MIKSAISQPWLLSLALTAMLATSISAQPLDWGRYENPQYGYRIDIPYGLFVPVGDVAGRLSFRGADERSQLTIYGEENAELLSLAQIADELSRSDSISEITYRKAGRSWVVLSGHFRGEAADEQIFYLKLMLSNDRRRYAVFAINYPRSAKAQFDPIVERLEDSFGRPT